MKNYLLSFLLLLTIQLHAQEIVKPASRIDKTTMGLGIGLDYGGFGMNFTTSLHKNIALFGGVGYNLIGLGYNGGIKARYISDKNTARISPFILGMYGVNTAVIISNATEFNKSFRGITFGLGIDFNFKPRKNGYWSIALLMPQRSSKYDDYISFLKSYYGFTFTNQPSDIGLSLGYKIILH